MGDTSSLMEETDALEGVFGDGRETANLWLAGEAMAELCREFAISRKTGYKIVDRYQECGFEGTPGVDTLCDLDLQGYFPAKFVSLLADSVKKYC